MYYCSEDNKPDAIEMLSRVAAQSGENIRVMALKSKCHKVLKN